MAAYGMSTKLLLLRWHQLHRGEQRVRKLRLKRM